MTNNMIGERSCLQKDKALFNIFAIFDYFLSVARPYVYKKLDERFLQHMRLWFLTRLKACNEIRCYKKAKTNTLV